MSIKPVILCLLLALTPMCSAAIAAPFFGPVCAIEGKVEKIAKRKEIHDSKDRNVFGYREFTEYTDVYLNLSKVELIRGSKLSEEYLVDKNCSVESLRRNGVFQLRDPEKVTLQNGDIITAKTEYLMDEWIQGQWLYDINIVH